MVIKINGKEMKDAVIKMDGFDWKILDLSGDRMKVSVTDTYGEAFNFVPRFVKLTYPDKTTVTAKTEPPVVVGVRKTVEHTVVFPEKIRLETGMKILLNYSMKKVAEITVE